MNKIPFQLTLNGRLFDLSKPAVMAIANLTPDSFFSGSRLFSEREVLNRVEKAFAEGASILDVGAYSTRPSAAHITEEEELERLRLPLKAIRKHFPDIVISLDTFRSGVARWGVEECHVDIINDISGGTMDDMMFETVAVLNTAYILTHTRGTPQTMQQLTKYENMMSEMLFYFGKKVAQLVHLGVKDIIIDPGFGFAKTLDQNYELLKKMSYYKELNLPVLFGISRKSMIYNLLGNTPEEALNGTTALNMLGLMNGADILRVHDVKEAVEAVKLFEKYNNS
ncbi:MAG TPA: dihydropteroate synthase [Paludibacteraceae bacterium]|nr:dihydropteroate synthase [Paludibacteraceae bacterium]